jgi:hypothetical protein
LSVFFLTAITILSGLITIVTGSITIIGYFQRKPVSPSKPNVQPTSQGILPSQVYVLPPQQYTQPPLYTKPKPPVVLHVTTAQQHSKKRSRLSHPRIALIALIGQVLLVTAAAIYIYIGSKYGTNSSGTFEYNLLAVISLLTVIGGLACAIPALVMSLLKTKQLHRWGWFTVLIVGFIGLFILFLPTLIPLLFGIFGPQEQRAAKTQAVFP